MARRVVGLFDKRDIAQQAQKDLIQAGFPAGAIHLENQPPVDAKKHKETAKEAGGFWESVREFFGGEDTEVYTEAARRGGTLVVVDAPENRVEQAVTVLQRHNPTDVDRQAETWRQGGWQPTTQTGSKTAQKVAQTGAETIPVVEEQLKVGKRREQRGGVRIYTHVTEHPVQEDVQLREEHVSVQRRPVDRPAGADAFRERTIEATEYREEPVVSKEARVVEEVSLNKDVRQRTETVKDTVRRTDVDVKQLEDDFRKHYQNAYAKTGQPYEQYQPAYEYGRQLACDQRYRDQEWTVVEPEARKSFEQRNPGKWTQFKDAVQRGYNQSRKVAPRP